MANEDIEEKSLAQSLYQSLVEMTGPMDNLLIQPEGVRLQLIGLYPFVQGDIKLLIEQYLRPSERCWILPSVSVLLMLVETDSSAPLLMSLRNCTSEERVVKETASIKLLQRIRCG